MNLVTIKITFDHSSLVTTEFFSDNDQFFLGNNLKISITRSTVQIESSSIKQQKIFKQQLKKIQSSNFRSSIDQPKFSITKTGLTKKNSYIVSKL
jgi:hypothetical protein